MSCRSLALGSVPGEPGYYWSARGGSRPRRHVRPWLSPVATSHDEQCSVAMRAEEDAVPVRKEKGKDKVL